jgi:outer membrane protein OmpA-like peptidoglycan-associated protein
MGANSTPGPQGKGAGGVQSIDNGTLVRTRSCSRGVTSGNRLIKQKRSWAIGAAQTPQHRTRIAQIYFPTNGYRLDGNDRAALRSLCASIRKAASQTGHGAALLAVGAADHRGDATYNLRLAARRAISVRKYIKPKVPGVVIWARTVGEALAEQPDLCRAVSQQQLAEDRRVDVIYGKYKIIIGDDAQIVIPSLPKLIEEVTGIVSGKKSSYPNRCRRILCYLKKLKGKPSAKNDSYWSYGDWFACWKFAFVNGKFTEEGFRKAAQELRKRRKSARQFLRENVATKEKADDKFQQLAFLDKIIFDSWQKVADRLKSSGSEKGFPYWVAVKNQIIDMNKDPETLYSCLQFTKGSVWEYVPV